MDDAHTDDEPSKSIRAFIFGLAPFFKQLSPCFLLYLYCFFIYMFILFYFYFIFICPVFLASSFEDYTFYLYIYFS